MVQREMAKINERRPAIRLSETDETVPRWLGPGALIGFVSIFAVVVVSMSFSVRNDIRSQLMARDAYVLNLVVGNQIEKAEDEYLEFDFEVLQEDELWISLLDTSDVKGVFSVQLFSPAGEQLRSSNDGVLMKTVPAPILEKVVNGETFTDFYEAAFLDDFIELGIAAQEGVSILEIYVLLQSYQEGKLLGVARFLMAGGGLAGDFTLLDQRMARQTLIAAGGGSLLVVGLFWLAWRRLETANRHVSLQAKRLRKANGELAMLARTSAIGSVSAHLIHGLKNPLASLTQIVSDQSSGSVPLDAEDWQGANEAARRMQDMVQEVVDLLQDSAAGSCYEVSLDELKEQVDARFLALSEERGVSFKCECEGQAVFESHLVNIVLLIVSNLTQNALDAVVAGDDVRVSIWTDEQNLVVDVSDSGPGIDGVARETLFTPVHSKKDGGAGIGLAICMQMAKYIGGNIQYMDTNRNGALFELVVPVSNEAAYEED